MSEATRHDAWQAGDSYEAYMGRWSRQVAPRFLDWLGAPGGLDWLDVGCGTGALSAAILDHAGPTTLTAVEPSGGFLETARRNLGPRAVLHQGQATALPLPDAAVDVVVSGLVVNFVPQPAAALAEMRRVTARGGTVGAYVWDYAQGMQLMRAFWDAAVAEDPPAAALDEGARFPLCRPAALGALFEGAGFTAVETIAIDVPTPFASFADYWEPFLGGQGPAPAYAMSLGEPARVRLRDRLHKRLPAAADGSITLTARAWAVRGAVPP